MKKLFLFFLFIFYLKANDSMNLPNVYPSIIDHLIFFKQDRFKVFYGGPVDRKSKGIKWLMPASFEDSSNKTRAVYEISFINCSLDDAKDAEILFVEVSDINIKLKNNLSKDYKTFSNLISGDYKDDKYIVIRFADIANVYYPDIYIFSEYGKKIENDKNQIVKFLHENFKTQDKYTNFYQTDSLNEISYENDQYIYYATKQVETIIDEKSNIFFIQKRIKKNDTWKAYYIISKIKNIVDNEIQTLRIDSGCISGQIYDDDACDCLDQLHDALKKMSEDSNNGIIIHIPAHDGRGFGTAPKAETEIYKRGGQGRVHSTIALDTITAAKLLYGIQCYDLRTFDGVGQIIKSFNIKKIILLTDNVEKINSLRKQGIEVIRQKTNSHKSSCLNHIIAKKSSPSYFQDDQ